MKRALVDTLIVLLLFASAASAQTPAATASAPQALAAVAFPADARVAFVNLEAVVQNSAFGRSGQEQLKSLSDQKMAELAEKTKALQALEQEIQSGQNVLAASVLQQKTAELDRARRESQFLREQAQIDYNALQSQLLEAFSQRVLPIVEQIRSERNLWAVFSAGEDSGLLAVGPALDLSAEVVSRLDAAQ